MMGGELLPKRSPDKDQRLVTINGIYHVKYSSLWFKSLCLHYTADCSSCLRYPVSLFVLFLFSASLLPLHSAWVLINPMCAWLFIMVPRRTLNHITKKLDVQAEMGGYTFCFLHCLSLSYSYDVKCKQSMN